MSKPDTEPGSIIRALRVVRDDVVQAVIAGIQSEEPAYTRFESDREEALWTQTVAWLVDVFFQVAADRRRLTLDEMQSIRDIGMTRHAQSFDLGTTRAAVRAAVAVVHDRIERELPDASGSQPEAKRLTTLLARFGTAVEELIAEGFQTAREANPADSRAKALVQDIAGHAVHNGEEVVRRVAELACTASEWVLLLTPDTAAAVQVASALKRVHTARRPSGRFAHTLLAVPVPAVGWAAAAAQLSDIALETGVTLLSVGPSSDLADLYDRYLCAVPLVPHLHNLGEPGDILDDTALELVAIMAVLPKDIRQALVRRVVGRPVETCRPDEAERHLEHLENSVLGNFSVAAVQRRTQVEKSTVYRHRDQFTATFKRSLSDAHDRAVLSLVYHATRLDGDPRATRVDPPLA